MVNRERLKPSSELMHVENLIQEEKEVRARFEMLVDNLLKDYPKETIASLFRPEVIGLTFKLGKSTVYVTGNKTEDGSIIDHFLEISTPIIVDDIDNSDVRHPNDLQEIVTFRINTYLNSLEVGAKVLNQIDYLDFSREITIDKYTAGGLLPPINTLGIGKIEAFKNVITLLQGVDPRSPEHQIPQAV